MRQCTYGGRGLIKTLGLLYEVISRKTAAHTCRNWLGSACGSRTEAMQNNSIFNSLAAVINESNAAGNSEKIVHVFANSLYVL